MGKTGSRKHGRSKRKPSSGNKERNIKRNKIRKLKKALMKNPNCENTRSKLKALGQGSIVQEIDLKP